MSNIMSSHIKYCKNVLTGEITDYTFLFANSAFICVVVEKGVLTRHKRRASFKCDDKSTIYSGKLKLYGHIATQLDLYTLYRPAYVLLCTVTLIMQIGSADT